MKFFFFFKLHPPVDRAGSTNFWNDINFFPTIAKDENFEKNILIIRKKDVNIL